jgi:hypothetical protein
MVFCDGSEKVFLNGEIAHRHHEPRLFFGLRRQSAAAMALSELGGAWIFVDASPKAVSRSACHRTPKPGGSSDGSGEGKLRIICLQIREAGA